MNIKNDRFERSKKFGFVGASLSLATVFTASSAPIPLYSIYSEMLGMTSSALSMTAVAYFVGTILTLLMFARLSNYLGRRPVIFATLGFAIIGCLFFIYLDNFAMFLIGRLIQGIACGLAFSTLTTYIVDITTGWLVAIGAAVTSAASMVGSAIGSFLSGTIREYGSGSLSLPYWIVIGILILCIILMVLGPETDSRKEGALASIIPQVKVPANIRVLIPAAVAIFVGTWSISGFYQSFSSTIALEYLHTSNTLVAAALFTSLTAPNVIGCLLAGRLKVVTAQRFGITAFFICVCGILYALKTGSAVQLIAISILAGIAQGSGFTGSMQRLLAKTSQKDRAGVLSVIYLVSYCGAAVPNLIVGTISGMFSLFQIAIGYAGFVFIAFIVTLWTSDSGRERFHFKKHKKIIEQR